MQTILLFIYIWTTLHQSSVGTMYIKMAFRRWDDGGPTLNAGLVALWFYSGSGPVLLRDPILL